MIERLSDNSEAVLKARYYINSDEDWPKLGHRVTDNVIPMSCRKYDYTEEEIQCITNRLFEHINNLDFIPNSPTMFNAGTEYPMLSACFIIDVPDNLSGIYDSVKESALIHKMGGGVGFSLSRLRGRGSKIATTHGKSGGAVSFLKVFSHGTAEITAAGKRKGANMAMLRIDHADALEFINCKSIEGELPNFNISMQLTDAFMEACKNDDEFNLLDPKDGAVVYTVRARALMTKIAEGAWRNGEPGICFIDAINRDNPIPHVGEITSSNPCQPGWATVLTPEGVRTISDINIGDTIWSGKRWTAVVNKQNTGVKEVLAYKTRAGVFYGTENHRVVQDGLKIEANEATNIDIAVGPIDRENIEWRPAEIMDGLVLGDGTYHKASNSVILIIGDNDKSYFDDKGICPLIVGPAFGIKPKAFKIKTSYKSLPLPYDRTIHRQYRFGDIVSKCSFLRGLYSANGSVVGKRVILKASSIKVIEIVQEMLSSIGISSYYTVNQAHDVEFENGTYMCRESYDLNIGSELGRGLFSSLIGFIQSYKQEKLNEACTPNKKAKAPKVSYDIVEINSVSVEEVFDLTVDAPEHTYWTAGLLVSNCGEFYNVPYNSCNLGSINLTKYVIGGVFDWDRFRSDIFDYVAYLDCIIDANHYPLEKIADVSQRTRPVGLGVMGFADCLILMDIKYDTEEGFDFAKEMSEKLSYYSLEASVELSKKRGPYTEFRVENHKYEMAAKLGTLDWAGLVRRIGKHGLRNSHTVVIAPTGTLARIANEVSFGMEPVTALESKSNILNGEGIETKHRLYQEFLEGSLKVRPEVFVCARDIAWQDHVRMQAEWQKFVHNGISKTINMPNNATVDDVYGAYMLAYELGLKGITVYRDGSRKLEVIVDTSKKSSYNEDRVFEFNTPIKRPLELECEIHNTQVSGEKWVVLVGLMDGKPYEIFGGLQKYIELPKKYTKGLIVKKANKTTKSRYDLVLSKGTSDEITIKDVVSVFENQTHGVVGRLISLSLRHGTRPAILSEQLAKDEDSDFQTYAKVMGRILKRYIINGEAPESTTKCCPECSGKLGYQEGCVACLSCGWSKCS